MYTFCTDTLYTFFFSNLKYSNIIQIQNYSTCTTTVQKKESIYMSTHVPPQPRNTSTKKKYRVYTILQSMELNRLILLL